MTTRTFHLMSLTLAFGLVAGCGKNEPAPQANTEKGSSPPAASNNTPGTTTTPTPVAPPPPADPWEMDATRHAIPEKPVSGQIMKAEFKPDVFLLGDLLTFQAPKGDTYVTVKLPAKLITDAATGAKLRVTPGTAQGPEVPEVTVTVPGGTTPLQYPFASGYALTFELTKKERGQAAGKIYLVLPEMGDKKDEKDGKQKNYFSGTFATEWQRTADMLPDADDVPFVQGKLLVEGKPSPMVKVGCVGVFPGDMIGIEGVETTLSGMGASSHLGAAAIVVDPAKPGVGRYELTHLKAGRYFVYATLPGGPATGKWINVEDATKETLNLTLSASPTGSLEVTVPATVEKVMVTPSDEKVNASIASAIALGLGTEKKPTDGKVKFESLAPGKYDVWSLEKLGTVEVKAGETAKLDGMKK